MTETLTLPAELTIYTAASTREAWLAEIAQGTAEPLPVRGADVTEIDGAGLQLLVALRRALDAQQCTLQVVDASEVLRHACAIAGLDGLLCREDAA